jgi:hypothetical protein
MSCVVALVSMNWLKADFGKLPLRSMRRV